MAKIPNKVIVDFIDVIDHTKFRVRYRTVNGVDLTYPPDDGYLNIDSIDDEAKVRLQEKINTRISPFKRNRS